jgi:hypothetical protein
MHHALRPDCLLHNERKEPRSADPLPRLLTQLLERAGGAATITRATSRPWASALFQGRRHVIAMQFSGTEKDEGLRHFLTGLEEAEWSLPRHFVADLTVDDRYETAYGECVELSALTIEDW